VVAAGEHVIEWDGRDQDGRAVASGVYFCRLRGAGSEAVRKMVLVR
jgi:flagellar hook assembly protein FlgD